ncbi:sensor histidine kinase [Flavobacterium humi]|uniref:histidine kinase n=1 Tax=Flavobacterium humi TaxID=2562683 RepID=A0A4Z0L5U3_9FLAO|nr:ATP-binding protein [Flavobacterium humi]TGD57752.1 histidine kinase [Flavobacterium humi]
MQREEIQLLIISFSIVLFSLLLTLFVLFYFFQKKKSKFLIDKMEADLLFQSELTKSKIEIKEQTLTNVSRELHDNIGQILSVALMQMNILIEDENKYTKENLVNLKFLVNKSLDEIRILSKLMNGDIVLKSSFIEAVSDDLERIKQLKKIKCKLNITGEPQEINKEHDTIIYRILQESISNILRHSHSESITINIFFTEDNCKISVIDFGKGFDYKNGSKGSGLTNIKTRAELIGASFTIHSEISKGSEITIDYPLKREENF